MREMKRMNIRVTVEVKDQLQSIADAYGMSLNGITAYALGQFCHAHSAIDKTTRQLPSEVMRRMKEAGAWPGGSNG